MVYYDITGPLTVGDGRFARHRSPNPAAQNLSPTRIPATRLFFGFLCFSVFSSTWGNPEVGGVDKLLGSYQPLSSAYHSSIILPAKSQPFRFSLPFDHQVQLTIQASSFQIQLTIQPSNSAYHSSIILPASPNHYIQLIIRPSSSAHHSSIILPVKSRPTKSKVRTVAAPSGRFARGSPRKKPAVRGIISCRIVSCRAAPRRAVPCRYCTMT